MDFPTIVELARQLHVDARPVSEVSCSGGVAGAVYGRICSSSSRDCPPEKLTDAQDRKTAFVFGSDAITSVILRSESYSAISSLGFTKDYIKHEVLFCNKIGRGVHVAHLPSKREAWSIYNKLWGRIATHHKIVWYQSPFVLPSSLGIL